MKKFKLFFALFAMLALGVTNVWGEEVEMSKFTATSADMDTYISYATAKGNGTSAPVVNDEQIRLYQGEPGGNITISAKDGATITEVTIGSGMATKIRWEIDGTTDESNTSLEKNAKATKSGLSASKVTCHCYGSDKNSRLYVNYLKVVYTGGSGETPNPEPEPEPEPDINGESLSHTWDWTAASYSDASANTVSWSADDVSMVLTKETSSTTANNYLGGANAHTRVYKDQKITFTPGSEVTINSIVFTATTNAYATNFQNATWTNATASTNGTTVTVTPTNGANVISCIINSATRATAVTVNYTKAGEDPDAVKYTITTAVNDEKMGSVSGAGTYAENAQVTLTATAKPGYKFVQWNDGFVENPRLITVTQDSTYTATFQALDIVTVADAMALGTDKEFVLNQFTVVQVQGSNTYIKDATGYGFIYKKDFVLKAGDVVESMPGKKGEYNGFGQLLPLVTTADLTITKGEIPEPEEFTTAPIAKDIYKYVKIDSVTVFEGAFKLLNGTKINYYNATLTEGHIYNIVGSVGHHNGTLQIVIASSTDITPKYTVTATAENGTVTGDGEYVQGSSATLTAAPAEGYEFTCWTSGNDTVSTDNPLILTVSADTALVANFAKKTFTIDVNVTPAESGTVTGLAERGVYEYGATATLTATPADNYEFVFWAAGEDTLSTETTYSFEVKDNAKLLAVFKYTKCTPLNAPVVTYTTTYNSATLTWEAVDNAVAYLVTVGNFFNEVTETTYTAIRLEAATEYTYSVQAISGDPKAYCDSEATYGALTTAEYPAATLTLSENGETRNLEGNFRLNDIVTLPTTADECSKTFVGWDSNAECAVAPEYAPGAEYQLNELTQTLYAVYADNKPGETVSIKYSGTTTTNMTEGNNATTLGLDENEWTVIADKGKASNNVGLNKEGTIRLYWNADGSNTLTITASKTVATVSLNMKNNNNNAWVKVGENTITPSTAGVYTIDTTTFVIGNANTSNVQVHIYSIEVTLIATEYTNYSTTCPAAPVVEVAPAEVTATVEGATGKLTVEYENVLLEKVAIDLFNDKKCTEAFTGDWLTATLDADYNITYTVAASTLYTEREAYILLTAPAVDGTEPATALIPVTQAGKEAVFASLEELLANVTPTREGINVTVTLTDEEIVEIFVTSKGYRNGVNLNVPYQGGTKKIQIFCYDVPESWVKGGKVSGTITCPWKDYNGTWELCPKSWDELTYTAPTTTALDNAVVAGKTTKMIINGQLIIVKDGVKYNAQGAQL